MPALAMLQEIASISEEKSNSRSLDAAQVDAKKHDQ